MALILALAHPWIERRFSAAVADRLVVLLRLLQVLGLLVGLALLMKFRVVGAIFSYVAPLLWTWVVPLRTSASSRATTASRGLLAFILLLQYLHAYPVGGSQESWGTFLFIPLVALGLAEIRAWAAVPQSGRVLPPRWWPMLASGLLIVPVVKAGWATAAAHGRYAERQDLRVTGRGESSGQPDAQRTAYQLLVLNAVVHGDQLFSLPGLFSLNLWTELPTPTSKNTTLWFTLLNTEEQAEILHALARSPRPCVIVQESLVQLMQASKVPIRGLLVDYIQREFTVSFRVEGFAFLVRKGRPIAPLGVARLSPVTAGSGAGTPDTQLELCLASDGRSIAAFEVSDMAAPLVPPRLLDATNTAVTLGPINSAGFPLGPPQPAPWPLNAKGLCSHASPLQPRGPGTLSLQHAAAFEG